MSRKKRGKRRIKRPGRLRYVLLGGLISIYAAAFKKHKVVSGLPGGLKPPFIMIGNHTSFYDFIYAIRSMYPARINFVVARKYFHFPGLGFVMKLGRAIPKSLYQSDTGTIIAMLDILRQGGVVGLFPEGQISIDGVTLDCADSIAKLVRKAGVPVVRVLTGGAYFCNPPWGKTARKGPVESRVDLVLTKEQTAKLPVDVIMEKLRESIRLDSYAWQRGAGSVYKGKDLACGLEDILYVCPRCEEEYTIGTQGDRLVCAGCGLTARFGADGHLDWPGERYFRHIGGWHAWQVERERDEIIRSDAFCVSEPVALAMLKTAGRGVYVAGGGTFAADREAFTYTGTLDGEKVRLTFPVAGVRFLPVDTGRNFQIYKNNLLYEFRPENPKWCMKIANICDALHTLPEQEEAAEAALLHGVRTL